MEHPISFLMIPGICVLIIQIAISFHPLTSYYQDSFCIFPRMSRKGITTIAHRNA
jgi:hypothetical protein